MPTPTGGKKIVVHKADGTESTFHVDADHKAAIVLSTTGATFHGWKDGETTQKDFAVAMPAGGWISSEDE